MKKRNGKNRLMRLPSICLLICLIWIPVLTAEATQEYSEEAETADDGYSVSDSDAGNYIPNDSLDTDAVGSDDCIDINDVFSVNGSDAGGDIPEELEAGLPEESFEVVDISDMVYQEGGWGIPADEYAVQLYAIGNENALKAEIKLTLQNSQGELDVRKYDLLVEDWRAVASLTASIINENPELFYCAGAFGYEYTSSGKITRLSFYYYDYSEESKLLYAEKLKQAATLVTSSMTDAEKALVLHDYLVQNCAYAYAEYQAGTLGQHRDFFTAYGALVEGRAVCQGYAEAYSALHQTVGISSFICYSSEMNHAWNIVRIDGEWYHADATWDDPVENLEGRVQHLYFLLSDGGISNKKHSGWISDVECISDKYDTCWWQEVSSRIVIAGGSKYYIVFEGAGNAKLKVRTGDTVLTKCSNSAVWFVCSFLSAQGDMLYFNDKQNLYAMKLSDNTPQIIYTYTGGDGYICGAMVYSNKTARLNLSTMTDDSYITISLRSTAPGTVDGTVRYPGHKGGQTTVQIINNTGQVVYETKADSSGEYELQNVASGTYTMRVSRPSYVTREYSLTVGDQAVNRDIDLKLSGDVNGDGTIDARDKKIICSHVTYPVLTGYEFLVGDVDHSGKIDARDKKIIFNHIAGTGPLW